MVLIIILLIIAGLTGWAIYDNTRVVTTTYYLSEEAFPEDLTIVQISDFHNSQRMAEKMVNAVAKTQPQFIVITGDFIDEHHADIDLAADTARKLMEIAPCYYVAGNHEAISGEYKALKKQLKKAGVRIMTEKSKKWEDNVMLHGAQDPDFEWGYLDDSADTMEKNLAQLKPSDKKYDILLSHRPEAMQSYVNHKFDLVLTGHAHGGQFRIPFIGGVFAPDQGLFPEYDAGMYQEGDTTMIVNRGIGNSIIPFRINNPPEIVVVKAGAR